MIGICRLFRAAACLKRAFCLSAHSTRALCCKIVTKSRELLLLLFMPTARTSEFAVGLEEKGKGECFNNHLRQPLKATFPKSGFLG